MINSGQIGGLGGIISTGKEANVYHGTALIPYVNEKNEQVDEPECKLFISFLLIFISFQSL